MVVNKKAYLAALLLLIGTVSFCHASDNEITKDEIANHLTRKVMLSIVQLKDAIEVCDQKASSRPLPVFDKTKLAELNASREDILVALAHQNFSNRAGCTREARLSMAYNLGFLLSAQDELDLSAEQLDDLQQELMYPSVETVRYEMKYQELPADLKTYLEGLVGKEPFELMDLLKKNDLFLE